MGYGDKRPGSFAFAMGTSEDGQPLEDRAMKQMVQFFGDELLPLLGVTGKVKRVAPTEQIHLEMKSFLEDFNFEMEDGTWCHLEFESDRITFDDLRRFRSYEAVTGYYYGVEVVTYVVCTAKAKVPVRELKQGINTYRVKLIRLKGRNADKTIKELERKQGTGKIKKEDLAGLLLTPLMSGSMSISDRIRRSIRLLQQEHDILGKEDLLRMESVLYAFAMKFLSKAELSEMQEVFAMTILGQMLEARGIEKGIEKGIEQGIKALIQDNLEDGKTEAQILEKLVRRFSLTRERAKQYYDHFVNAPVE